MKKLFIALVVLAVTAIGYWLISPLFIEKAVNESVDDIMAAQSDEDDSEETSEPEVVSRGSFSGRANHNSSGTATLLEVEGKHYVRFEDDFSVTNGPDLFVHFGKDGDYVASARIGALKGNVGGQNYEVPSELDPADYNEVWIWCRAFSVPFAVAELAPEEDSTL